MGSNSSKHSRERARESRTKKNLRSAERLERDRHSDNGFFHRQPDYEAIRANALRKAHLQGARPPPARFPLMPSAPAPVYQKHRADRRPQPPQNLPPAPSSEYSDASAVPAPLNIRKKTTAPLPPLPAPPLTPLHPSAIAARPSSSKRSRDVPSTGRPMFRPATNPPPPMAGAYYPPTSSNTKTTNSSSRRARSRSPNRQRQPPSSARHGPSTARYPPSSDRAPQTLSCRRILPQAQPHGHVAPPPVPQRSGRRRVTREDVRGRR